ncbi:hypothetical protein SPURM210S_01116 [Streptomyces purpurascens]
MAAGLGGGGPARSGAEVVHAVLCGGRGGLGLGVRGPADQDVVAEDRAGCRHREVALAEVQHVGAGGVGDVRPVVDREQLAVPSTGVGEDGQPLQLLARLHALVPQLHDVDPTGQHGIEELHEVALPLAGVGAEVDPGVGELSPCGGGGGVGHACPSGCRWRTGADTRAGGGDVRVREAPERAGGGPLSVAARKGPRQGPGRSRVCHPGQAAAQPRWEAETRPGCRAVQGPRQGSRNARPGRPTPHTGREPPQDRGPTGRGPYSGQLFRSGPARTAPDGCSVEAGSDRERLGAALHLRAAILTQCLRGVQGRLGSGAKSHCSMSSSVEP